MSLGRAVTAGHLHGTNTPQNTYNATGQPINVVVRQVKHTRNVPRVNTKKGPSLRTLFNDTCARLVLTGGRGRMRRFAATSRPKSMNPTALFNHERAINGEWPVSYLTPQPNPVLLEKILLSRTGYRQPPILAPEWKWSINCRSDAF